MSERGSQEWKKRTYTYRWALGSELQTQKQLTKQSVSYNLPPVQKCRRYLMRWTNSNSMRRWGKKCSCLEMGPCNSAGGNLGQTRPNIQHEHSPGTQASLPGGILQICGSRKTQRVDKSAADSGRGSTPWAKISVLLGLPYKIQHF